MILGGHKVKRIKFELHLVGTMTMVMRLLYLIFYLTDQRIKHVLKKKILI